MRSLPRYPRDGSLDEAEREILALACHERDDVAALEEAIKREGMGVPDSTGQPASTPEW